MSKTMRTVFIVMAIIIAALACTCETQAATVKYAKNVSDIDHYHSYVLEAAEYPKSSTKKIDGYVATPNASGWMDLKKYNASTAKANHQLWDITNHAYDYNLGEVIAPDYDIANPDPLPYWSNDFMWRAVTYTSKGFYRQNEIFGEFGTMYEHFNSPAQRFKIVKVRVDPKTGRTIFKFVNSKSGIALAAGGYAMFYVRIEPWQ